MERYTRTLEEQGFAQHWARRQKLSLFAHLADGNLPYHRDHRPHLITQRWQTTSWPWRRRLFTPLAGHGRLCFR